MAIKTPEKDKDDDKDDDDDDDDPPRRPPTRTPTPTATITPTVFLTFTPTARPNLAGVAALITGGVRQTPVVVGAQVSPPPSSVIAPPRTGSAGLQGDRSGQAVRFAGIAASFISGALILLAMRRRGIR
jgi:hypothetical protein